MPVPKGKQRRKPRNRVRRAPTNESAEASSVAAPKTSAGKTMRRARRQPPLWLNILLGLIMVVAGPYFTFFTSGGLAIPARVILLLGYFLIGGYYFVKAYRQYRERAAT
jgi:hypothetical protein